VRRDFPALHQRINDHSLVYLDSAATALKPQSVIDAITGFYARDSANVHRGVHQLSQRATEAFEGARSKLRVFLNAPRTEELIFVRGTTEGINLVAQAYARPRLVAGDEILVTGLEHHSNIVPWQLLAQQTGARLVVAPIADDGSVPLAGVEERLSARTRLVAVSHVSNALGSILPITEIAERAHAVGAKVLVDGAQATPHMQVDLSSLGADFYAFSGHKLYGPTGIGVLWGRTEILEEMSPYQGGGDMIRSVSFEKTTFADIPHKFEAGTPDIAGAIGLGAAVDYLSAIGFGPIVEHERDLLGYATKALQAVPGLRIIGNASAKVGVLSFVVDGIHAHDLGTIADATGVAIRTGHHCAQPVMRHFGVPSTARASLGLYNTRDDITRLVQALDQAKDMFQ
jgi:cysteine desulfurase/selenocysteine lyase